MPNMPDHVYKGPIFKRLDDLYSTAEGRRAMRVALEAVKPEVNPGSFESDLANLGGDPAFNQFLTEQDREGGSVFRRGGEAGEAAGNPFRNQVAHVESHWFGKRAKLPAEETSSSTGSTHSDTHPAPKYDPDKGWWNDGTEVAKIIRLGAIAALDIAGFENDGSSIDVLWACFGNEPEPGTEVAAPAHGHDAVKTQVFISWKTLPGGVGKRVTMLIITPEEPHDIPNAPMTVKYQQVARLGESGIAVVEKLDASLPGVPEGLAGTIGLRLCEDERGYYPKA